MIRKQEFPSKNQLSCQCFNFLKPAVNRQPGFRRGTRRAESILHTEFTEKRKKNKKKKIEYIFVERHFQDNIQRY